MRTLQHCVCQTAVGGKIKWESTTGTGSIVSKPALA